MLNDFRKRITFLFLACLWLIAISVFAIDYTRTKNLIVESNSSELGLIQHSVIQSLSSVDLAYSHFDKDISERMAKYSDYLNDMYESGIDPKDWDYADLKDRFGMDVYVLNDQNKILYTSFTKDIGLDFSACCADFSQLLDERRESGEFYHDGLDLQQKTGEIKKFSYESTKDKKYLIELGYSLEQDEIFESFNFLKVTRDLENKYSIVDKIRVYNSEGYLLEKDSGDTVKIDSDRYGYLRSAFLDNRVVNAQVPGDGGIVNIRYVPYNTDVELGISTSRVVEIEYNTEVLDDLLYTMRTDFYMQLLFFILISIFLANITSKMVASPMYLAFHDSLTGLKNRAAYDSMVGQLIDRKVRFGMILLDLDNFKNVNDKLGHEKGDIVLKFVANSVSRSIRESDIAIRLGGDEFVIIIPNVGSVEDLEGVAERIRNSLTIEVEDSEYVMSSDDEKYCRVMMDNMGVTMSMGGVIYPEDGLDLDLLFEKVDLAMYESKRLGKNRYVYFEDMKKGDVVNDG